MCRSQLLTPNTVSRKARNHKNSWQIEESTRRAIQIMPCLVLYRVETSNRLNWSIAALFWATVATISFKSYEAWIQQGGGPQLLVCLDGGCCPKIPRGLDSRLAKKGWISWLGSWRTVEPHRPSEARVPTVTGAAESSLRGAPCRRPGSALEAKPAAGLRSKHSTRSFVSHQQRWSRAFPEQMRQALPGSQELAGPRPRARDLSCASLVSPALVAQLPAAARGRPLLSFSAPSPGRPGPGALPWRYADDEHEVGREVKRIDWSVPRLAQRERRMLRRLQRREGRDRVRGTECLGLTTLEVHMYLRGCLELERSPSYGFLTDRSSRCCCSVATAGHTDGLLRRR